MRKHSTSFQGSLAPWDVKGRDPGNEVGKHCFGKQRVTHAHNDKLTLLLETFLMNSTRN